MKEPSLGDGRIYIVICATSALLCFAWIMTGNLWLTLTVIMLGLLHVARYFPTIEEYITEDPILVWTRRISPLIIVAIFALTLVANNIR